MLGVGQYIKEGGIIGIRLHFNSTTTAARLGLVLSGSRGQSISSPIFLMARRSRLEQQQSDSHRDEQILLRGAAQHHSNIGPLISHLIVTFFSSLPGNRQVIRRSFEKKKRIIFIIFWDISK